MNTIQFSHDAIKLAENVLDAKELPKVFNDYREAMTIVNNYSNGNGYNKEYAAMLDARLRKEYPEINLLENAADNLARLASVLPSIGSRNNFKEDELISRLKFDANGILAGVLVKKGLMPDVSGIIKAIL